MNISRVARVVRRHWLMITLLTAAMAGLAAWKTMTAPSEYRSSALLQVQAPADLSGTISLQGTLSARERAVSIVALGNTGAVAQRARTSVASLSGVSACSFSQRGQSEFLDSSCTGTSPASVTAAANAYAAALQAAVDAQREARLSQLAAGYAAQLRTLRAHGVPASSFPNPPVYQTYRELQLLDAATVPETPFAPQPLRTVVLALLLGLIVNCSLALLYDRMRNRAATPDELARELGTPLLGTIPRIGRNATRGALV